MFFSGSYITRQDIDNLIDELKHRDHPDPLSIITNNKYYKHIPYIYKQLSGARQNRNCNYYLGLILEYYPDPDEITVNSKTLVAKYYKDAAEAGHLGAMYKLGNCYYCDGNNEGIKWGVKALEKGYELKVWDDATCDSRYIIDCFKGYTRKLRKYRVKAKKLEQELEQERLRPPEKGGSEYEKVKQHFGDLIN